MLPDALAESLGKVRGRARIRLENALRVVLLLAVGGVVIWLRNADLAPLVAEKASESLGRQVTIGHLEVRWADPIAVDITDLTVANAPWGSQPDMIRIGRFAALLDPGALWRGVLHYDRLRIPVLMLRGAQSDLVLKETADEMLTRGPGALGLLRVVEIADCGHAPALNVREQLELVAGFIGQHDRVGAALAA